MSRAPLHLRAAALASLAALAAGGCVLLPQRRPAPAGPPEESRVVVPPPPPYAPMPDLASSPAPDLPRAADPAAVGMDRDRLLQLDSLIEAGVVDGVAPGVALAVARHGRLVRLRGYGQLDWSDPRPVDDSTLYDLASLTKVVATTTAAMILVDEGRLDLDALLARYLAEWKPDGAKAGVTVRQLLTHSAGLPPYLPLWRELQGREAYYHRIGALDLDYAPGTRTVYSDLGMILLQAVIERITGEPIERFVERRVFRPLGMRDTRYSPLQTLDESEDGSATDAAPVDLDALLGRIAPTERDSTGVLIRGYVDDENARAMGGVAGHAGLFSSARDLAVFSQMLLGGGAYAGHRIVSDSVVRRFTRRQSAASSRALGWDTPGENSSAGDYFSARSFGHTGFTGTSLWIDPARDLFVVLLTNRIDPTRDNQKHVAFRRAVHDAIARAITDGDVARRSGTR